MNARISSLLVLSLIFSTASLQAQNLLQANTPRTGDGIESTDNGREMSQADFGRNTGLLGIQSNRTGERRNLGGAYIVRATVIIRGGAGYRSTQQIMTAKGQTKGIALSKLREQVSRIAGARVVSVQFIQ